MVSFDAVGVLKFAELVFYPIFYRGDDRVHEDDGTETLLAEVSGLKAGTNRGSIAPGKRNFGQPLAKPR